MKEYNPVIYPAKLWVTQKESDLEEFRYYEDEAKLEVEDSVALTFKDVYRDFTKERGVVVYIPQKSFDTAAHEAVHVATAIFGIIGADISTANDEPLAYLVEWAAKCINQ